MNFKKSYRPTNGYTPICKIGECSLKKLEFGIIELDAGQNLDFYTETRETAFIMLEGHCNVNVNGEKWENIGNRMNVFENRKGVFKSIKMVAEMVLIKTFEHRKLRNYLKNSFTMFKKNLLSIFSADEFLKFGKNSFRADVF